MPYRVLAPGKDGPDNPDKCNLLLYKLFILRLRGSHAQGDRSKVGIKCLLEFKQALLLQYKYVCPAEIHAAVKKMASPDINS